MKPLLRIVRSEESLHEILRAAREFLPENEVLYVEPFCGIAEIPFELELKTCILNDNNPHIINLYQQVKSGDFLKDGWLITRKTKLPDWARNRNRFNTLIRKGEIDTVEAAQLTFYLNHICRYFNFGSTGTLIGAYDPNGELPEIDWDAAAALMQNWQLTLGEYTELDIPEAGDLVVNAPGVYIRRWNGEAWDVSSHQALIHWLEQRANRALVFHRRRRVIENLYNHWVENGQVAQSERFFQVA